MPPLLAPPKFVFWALFGLTIATLLGIVYYQVREGGKIAAREEQRKSNDDARERIKAVPPADSGSTIARLRNASF